MPEAVTRIGPSLRSVSAPFRASMASLKKFVAIWIATEPPSVQSARSRLKFPVSFHARTQPAQTGTMAAGRVLGRAARMQALIWEPVTAAVKPESLGESTHFVLKALGFLRRLHSTGAARGTSGNAGIARNGAVSSTGCAFSGAAGGSPTGVAR